MAPVDGFWENRSAVVPAAILASFLCAFVLVVPLHRHGDASDYILMTESLLHDRDLVYAEQDLERHVTGKPAHFDSPAGLHTRVGRDDRTYYDCHSFYYSAAALPFYALLGYRGFLAFNAVCFFVLVLAFYHHLRQANTAARAWAWCLLSFGLSALCTYVAWIHPEVFYACLVGCFMFLWQRGRCTAAAVALGIAAGAQPILGVAGVGFLLVLLSEKRGVLLIGRAAVAMVLAAAPQVVFSLYAFATVHPILRYGGGSIDPGLFLRFLFDPAAGLLWFYPAVVAAVIAAPKTRQWGAMTSAAALILFASTSAERLLTHQVGLRYSAYVFPLIVFCVREIRFNRWPIVLAWCFAAFAATGLVIAPISNSEPGDLGGKLYLPYKVARRIPWYVEDAEAIRRRHRPVSDSVAASFMYSDGWLPGDTSVSLLISGAEEGVLTLGFEAWPAARGAPQSLVVLTGSGERVDTRLAAGGREKMAVQIRKHDVQVSRRGHAFVILTVQASGWRESSAGPSAKQRWLGVRLTSISRGENVLFSE